MVYFGQRSINISTWSDVSLVDDALRVIRNLIETINRSGYAKVKIPKDWGDVKLSSENFWEKIDAVFQGQNDLIGYIYQELFERVFNGCIDQNRSYKDAEAQLIDQKPTEGSAEYYGVFKQHEIWPEVPANIHISDEQELTNWAQKFLIEAPVNEISYTERCEAIFSNLIFHDEFSETLKGHGTITKESKYGKAPETGIYGFSSSVTNALSVLNKLDIQGKETKNILSEVQAMSGFECTEQGGKKAHLKFSHKFKGGNTQTISSEYHIKINTNNRNDGVYYQDRIYFGFIEHDRVKKIFVAHSGRHL